MARRAIRQRSVNEPTWRSGSERRNGIENDIEGKRARRWQQRARFCVTSPRLLRRTRAVRACTHARSVVRKHVWHVT